MKKLNIILLVLFLSFSSFSDIKYSPTGVEKMYTEYCDGYANGYVAGFLYIKGDWHPAPLLPPCPMQRIGETTYKHGYNRGFMDGSRAAAR